MLKSTGRYKAVFISDTHLGSKHCNSEELLAFLSNIETDKLYLVGDIVDVWRLQKKWYWPKKHNQILRKILKISEKTEVIYVSGNHDEVFRNFPKIRIGKISVEHRCVHIGADGKRYLVVHGDMFDNLMRTKTGRFVMRVGDFAYDSLILINRSVNGIRRLVGLQPWSLAKYLKRKAKLAANYIGEFEKQMALYCKRKGYDGVICGHIHHAEITSYDDVVYMNDGDWCESCTALVETHDGEWHIIKNEDLQK
jgi:UDP-2,3-diacylglucosamine pyrophosphatase LpxH